MKGTATPRLWLRPPPHATLRYYLGNETKPSALSWHWPHAGLSPAFLTLTAELRGHAIRLCTPTGCQAEAGV